MLLFWTAYGSSCTYVTEGSAESNLKITVECSFPEQSRST